MVFPFTDRELDLMAVLWDLESATVSQVQERLEDDLAYTTVLTTLRNMEEKGYVAHTEEGRAYRYHPRVPRTEAGSNAIRRVVGKVFGGSRELLLTHLVSRSDLSEEELKRVQELVAERLRGEEGEGEEPS